MARRKIVILVAGLLGALVLGAGLGGCKDLTFNGDMKGYLEYWTGTVTVGGFTWEAEPAPQKNESEVWTIPTNATVSISATIENPDNYPLDYGVGTAADTLRSVRTAGPVGGTVRVTRSSPTSIELELVPFSSVPTPESRALEHKDFTLTVVPTRTDSGLQAANPQVLTLRYNTPPRMPVEVVEEGGHLKLLGSDEWEMVLNSSNPDLNDAIYWAWPKVITDPNDPDYAARFQVYQDGALELDEEASQFLLDNVDASLLPLATAVTDAGYDIYTAPVDQGKEITIKAVDIEGVASQGTVSGRSPIQITLNANGGAFKNGSNTAVVYKAEGAMVSGGDFETPQLAGSVLSDWSLTQGGDPITFPHPVPSSPLTLYAQWRSDWSGYISSLGPGPHTVEIDTTLTESDVYALRAAIAASPDAKITLDLSKATFDNNRLPESAFNGEYTSQGKLSNLVGVTLPDNLAGVGDYAFQNTGLTSVTIPGSMTVIAGSAFLGCDQLTNVTIEHGVQTIWGNVFYGCSALTNVDIPDSVTLIGENAFRNTGLRDVTIPGSVTSIGQEAFAGCAQLDSVTIEDGVTSIEYGAFHSCPALTSATIPGSVKTIGWDSFKNCSALTSVTIGNGVETIDYAAFAYTGLTSVTIPGSVKTIGEDAFYGCAQLKNVTIADGVQTIGGEAFIHCTSLTDVTIPGSVQTIGQDAFKECSGLTSVTIANGVQSIGPWAFYGCSGLTDVTIPGSVQTIEQDAFANCAQLDSVTIADGVQTIGQGAFHGCPALTSVTIPNTVTSIEYGAFRDSASLTSVTIPASVQTIDQYAFQRSGLTSVTIPSSVKTWGWDVFHSCTQLTTVTLEHGLQSIGRGAFIHCTSLISVTIPDTVTSIGPYAFENTGLPSITIPSSVKTIGQYAFLNSNKLTTVNYRGSQSDWNNISIGSGNDTLNNAPTRNFDYVGP